MFKMELECKFGYKCWIVNSCDFFCLFSKYLELQLRMSTLILYFLLLDVVAKYCIKIFFFVLNYI